MIFWACTGSNVPRHQKLNPHTSRDNSSGNAGGMTGRKLEMVQLYRNDMMDEDEVNRLAEACHRGSRRLQNLDIKKR